MQIAIIDKLCKELNKPIKEESQVLYILAEIRKYIEEYDSSNAYKYKNLYFFCNWMLHITMDLPRSQQYLQKLENNLCNIRLKSEKEIAKDFYAKNKSFCLLKDLRSELNQFFKFNSLPNELVRNDNDWYRFIYYFLQILMDCSVVNINGKITKFSFERKDNIFSFRLNIKGFKGSIRVPLKSITQKIQFVINF